MRGCDSVCWQIEIFIDDRRFDDYSYGKEECNKDVTTAETTGSRIVKWWP